MKRSLRFLIFSVLLLLCGIPVFATQITVSSTNIPNWTFGGTTGTLRIFPNETFVTSTGQSILGGSANGFYKTISCTVAGSVLTCGAFTIDSTTDSSIPTVRYTANLYDQNGRLSNSFFSAFRVPTSLGSSVTWEQLRAYNASATASLPLTYYTAAQTDAAIVNALAGFAQTSLAGNYSNSLATAVSSIGITPTVLNINQDTVVPADLVVPENIVLNFTGAGKISVNSGKILSINSMVPPGNRKVFTGSGAVRLGPQIARINLVWWAGNDTSVDVTAAIDSALASLSYAAGGVLTFPCGTWKTTGGHLLSNSITIEGCGNHSDSVQGTVIKLTNAGASWVFKAVDAYRMIAFKNLSLDLNLGTAPVGLLFQGTAAAGGSVGLFVEQVSFTAGSAGSGTIPIKIDATDGAWDAEAIELHKISIIPPVNGIGIYINSHNESIRMTEPFFYMPNGSTAIKSLSSANVTITQPSFLGVASPPPPAIETVNRTATANITNGTNVLTLTSGNWTENDIGQKVVIAGKLDSYITDITSATVATTSANATGTSAGDTVSIYRTSRDTVNQAYAAYWQVGEYGNITIENEQDEGVAYFFINESTSPNTGVITFRNSYIQGVIQNKADAVFTSMGNHYYSQTYEDALTPVTQIYSFGDKVDKLTLYYAHTGNDRTITRERLIGPMSGATIVNAPFYSSTSTTYMQHQYMQRIWLGYNLWSANPQLTESVLSLGISNTNIDAGKPWLEFATLNDTTNRRSLTYKIARSSATGYMTFTGDQTGFVGYDFNGPIYTSVGTIRSGAQQLTEVGTTITANPKAGTNFYVTLTANDTLSLNTLTADEKTRTDGATISFELIQDGTGSRTLAFTTGAAGQFAFGTDIATCVLTTTASKRDIVTAKYSKLMDRWLITSCVRGF